ncbi:MAG TPA: arginine--tRNA ligase [Methylomirabilota bacterium]|nr:arginine--tRNA ligase [Methylomirabilota bacterium]
MKLSETVTIDASSMADDVTLVLSDAVREALARAGLPPVPRDDIVWDVPREAAHGDYATNVAMVLGKAQRRPPRPLAETIRDHLPPIPAVERAEVAGPGFLNVFLSPAFCQRGLARILAVGSRFGEGTEGRGLKAQVEFVSANPTGPLTLGHGRQAILGDCVARLFEAMGYETVREYYFNNAGRQMRVLGESVRARYLELIGRPAAFPEDGYQGEYIREIAQGLLDKHGQALAGDGHEPVFRQAAEDAIFADIRRTLDRLGIRFDVYSNEASLYTDGKVDETLAALRARGLVYDKDGATWLRLSAMDRPQDRVLVKSSGEPTYRLPDIAYHREKLRRSFDRILNVQGADHIEEAKDVVAAISALGLPAERIRYLIHQFVTITRGGVEVKMSTRRATYVTVDDLLDQVGSPDVFRYFMVTRSPESHLNFDLEAATETDWQKNPVFYVQYAHARVSSIEKHARERSVPSPTTAEEWAEVDLSRLAMPEELALIKALLRYPALVAGAARACEPHRVATYLHDLAAQFHGYHHLGTHNPTFRVVRPEDPALTRARLALTRAVGQVLENGLGLLGISAPESM